MFRIAFLLPIFALLSFTLYNIATNGDPDEEKRKPENALKYLKTADGLQTQLFASEPVMSNPTDIDIDDRGRVWVCEAFNYRPDINGNPIKKEGDRILILEDTDHDGKADKNTVFYQGPELESPLGIWVMGNKAIVSQSPYLWLFTDENGDDKADKKEIILQGIGGKQHDHGLHAVVFGPDGKFYFNFGNEGKTLRDKNGDAIKDADGDPIDLKKYKMGMVFRCDADFSNFEVLGNNFRNNYEVAVDSYGTLWQSDNDDDGNKGVRINYVMEYGNYGYTNEMTGAGWQVNRTNLEPDIPSRHWHQNDPGSIPNLLQTGAGSPCGMCIYEGDLLPWQYRGQIIHADAGPNVVRAYPVTNEGAGYKAKILNILEGVDDQWFRPSDVCTAPDGSIFVSDWYDPGVGGHNAGDQNRGRVFRIAPPAANKYVVPTFDYTTIEGAVEALQNPNMSVRWKAYNALLAFGSDAEEALATLFDTSKKGHLRARAMWLLTKMEDPMPYLEVAMNDEDPNIRILAIRAARQVKIPLIPFLRHFTADPNPQVRRECAIALHHLKDLEMPGLWVQLANLHQAGDRWNTEALGIGADGQWDACMEEYLKMNSGRDRIYPNQADIIWRARCAAVCPLLGKLATDESFSLERRLRYFRAFDFQKKEDAAPVLMKILKENATKPEIVQLALFHLDPDLVKNTPEAKTALLNLLSGLKGDLYLDFAERYNLTEENNRLYQMCMNGEHTSRASDILLKNPAGLATVNTTLKDKKKEEESLKLLSAIRWSGGAVQMGLLESVAFDKKKSDPMRQAAFEYLGNSWSGEERVLELLKQGKVEPKYIPMVVQGVSNAWRMNVRLEAASYLAGATSTTEQKIPAISDLLKLKGDPAKGVALFGQYCSNCHQVNGKGIDYGPKLSQIGGKLPREAQYLAILYPSAGVSHGYQGFAIKTKKGDQAVGLLASETATEITLKMPDGSLKSYPTQEVVSKKQLPDSLMPAGFHLSMKEQELADLVEYLTTLK